MKPSGLRIRAGMVDAAERALRKTATDILLRADKDVPREDGDLLASGRVEVVRVGDALEAKIEFTAGHAASQEIGGRSRESQAARDAGAEHGFIRFRNHPGGGKAHFLGDALKSGNRRFRANLKKAIAEDIGNAR